METRSTPRILTASHADPVGPASISVSRRRPLYQEAVCQKRTVLEVTARVKPDLEDRMRETLEFLVQPAVGRAVRRSLERALADIRQMTRAFERMRSSRIQDQDPADWWKRGCEETEDDEDLRF